MKKLLGIFVILGFVTEAAKITKADGKDIFFDAKGNSVIK
jgi:hypothetical protein